MFDLDCWLVTSYDLAVDVLRDPDTFTVDHPGFSTQQVIGPSMLSLDGAAHRLHRDPFAVPFRLQRIRSNVAPWIRGRATELVQSVEASGQADLRRAVARPLAVETMAHVLGLEGIDGDQLAAWYEEIVDAVDSVTMGRGVTSSGTAAFGALSTAVIASLDTSPLLRMVVTGSELSPEAVASNVAVLLFGGIVTGDGTNSLVVQHLLEGDGLLNRIAEDPSLVPAFVEESLRIEPAAAAVDRFATRGVALGGASIPAGDLVRVSLAAANRDPAVFPNPDVLDIDRANSGRHLTFARGPHSCLGIHLARAEAMAVVEAVVTGLTQPKLVEDRAVAPEGLVFRGLKRVPVNWRPR
ncbi:MAG TPA: cytochrome P450 [Acidimicrobiia bacterium]